MVNIRDRHAARHPGRSGLARLIRPGALALALLALAPLFLAELPEAPAEQPRQVAIPVEGLT